MSNNKDCQNRREAIAALVLDELEPQAADELRQHIDACETCRSLYQALTDEEETIRSAFNTITDRSQAIQDTLIQRLSEQFGESSRRTIRTILNAITKSRVTKLAAAAAVIIGGFWLMTFLGGPDMASVAWGEVANNVEHVRAIIFRLSSTQTGLPNVPKSEGVEEETVVYVSSEYGARMEINTDKKLRIITYVLLAEKAMLSVNPLMKQYTRTLWTEGYHLPLEKDPSAFTRAFLSAEYAELGRKTIGGIEVEGIKVNKPKELEDVLEAFVGRLWVDPETDLPVLIEVELKYHDQRQRKMVMDEFQWDVELNPSLFVPNVPTDYTLAQVEMPDLEDDREMIHALRAYAEIMDGKYPSDMMAMMTMSQEGGKQLLESIGTESTKELSQEEIQWAKEMTISFQAAYMFYVRLGQENKDPAYYGDKVTSDDVNAVLMRWKVSDDEYRVIFGNLTSERVSSERLTELENGSSELAAIQIGNVYERTVSPAQWVDKDKVLDMRSGEFINRNTAYSLQSPSIGVVRVNQLSRRHRFWRSLIGTKWRHTVTLSVANMHLTCVPTKADDDLPDYWKSNDYNDWPEIPTRKTSSYSWTVEPDKDDFEDPVFLFRTIDGAKGVMRIRKTDPRTKDVQLQYKFVNRPELSQPEEVAAIDDQFAVTLPNGIRVEVVGVSGCPSAGSLWWKPNGDVFEWPPYINTRRVFGEREGWQQYEVAYRVTSRKGGRYNPTIRFPGRVGVGHVNLVDEFGNPPRDVEATAIEVAADVTSITIPFGFSGKRQTVLATERDNASAEYDSKFVGISAPQEHNGTIKIDFTVSFDWTTGYNTHFLFVDHSGKKHGLGKYDEDMTDIQPASLGLRRHTFIIDDLHLSDIREFRFDVSPLDQWVTFKNISLVPGEDSSFEIEVE